MVGQQETPTAHGHITRTANEGGTHDNCVVMAIAEHGSLTVPAEAPPPHSTTLVQAWAQGATGVLFKGGRTERTHHACAPERFTRMLIIRLCEADGSSVSQHI